jgi:hypothetical protein
MRALLTNNENYKHLQTERFNRFNWLDSIELRNVVKNYNNRLMLLTILL